MNRTTQSTVTALQRLAEATGFKVTREEKKFLVHLDPDLPPSGKSSARTLALLAFAVIGSPEWAELREATAYDPGTTSYVERGRVIQTVRVPSGLTGWEQETLTRLAVTEII